MSSSSSTSSSSGSSSSSSSSGSSSSSSGGHASPHTAVPKISANCALDPALVNKKTLPYMKDVGLSIFASACSKNRGAFVLDPPDGHTYGCLAFPERMLEMAGISEEDTPVETIVDANDILKQYHVHNVTATDTVKLLDFLVQNVYSSTPNVDMEAYGCDVSGLVTLECGAGGVKDTNPLRAVTLAGLLSPARWATNGAPLTLTQAQDFYADRDFDDMKTAGLNAVQVPVSLEYFVEGNKMRHNSDWLDLVFSTLEKIRLAGLKAIVVLEVPPSTLEDRAISGAVVAAANFCADYNVQGKRDVVLAMTLPSQDAAVIQAAATAAPDLSLWLPTRGGDLGTLRATAEPAPAQVTGASLDVSHTATVADVASSTSEEDRGKLFYHESMACILRAPVEYTACYQDIPTFVGTGFDLAIDNCHLQNTGTFHDYGQCGRFHETVHSKWWFKHRQSFAKRQVYIYEQGLGWSFAAWKLYGEKDTHGSDDILLEKPAQLLSLRSVMAAGLFPSLFDLDNGCGNEDLVHANKTDKWPVSCACLNPPNDDFAMGDATLAPTPAPPPNCGNGWWNFTTEKCDFWIPPPPTTTAPCPVCPEIPADNNVVLNCTQNKDAVNAAQATPTNEMAGAFVAGFVLASLVAMVIHRCCNGKRSEYEAVPDGSGNGNYQGRV